MSQCVPLFPDLLGFGAVPRERVVDWTLFFDAPYKSPRQSVVARRSQSCAPEEQDVYSLTLSWFCAPAERHVLWRFNGTCRS
jgi:hypothetical protein